jgi:D-alanyl-lipoteichoic acid acyltransferase DltB (MBOAT superfamily)
LQIYFDFSGYSDMAIGIGLLFGIVLPQNFNSPYQATSIAEFWKRWHMTLSQFLRDYVYIPLGGNRHGLAKGILVSGFTLVIGGLWHGAAWTFVLWGLMHAFYIAIQRIWSKSGIELPDPLAITVTFLAVSVAWVMFRSVSVLQAISIWKGMLGFNGLALPRVFAELCDSCEQSSLINGVEWIVGGILLTVCMSSINFKQEAQQLQPNFKHLAYFTLLFFTSLWMSASHESFIYWQF